MTATGDSPDSGAERVVYDVTTEGQGPDQQARTPGSPSPSRAAVGRMGHSGNIRTYLPECTGADGCPARRHAHGCYEDRGACDAQTEHWLFEDGVRCVSCPVCAFSFDAGHTDPDGGWSCPACAEWALEGLIADTTTVTVQRSTYLAMANSSTEPTS